MNHKKECDVSGTTITFSGRTRKQVTVLRKDGTKESFPIYAFHSEKHADIIAELHKTISVTKKTGPHAEERSPLYDSMLHAFRQRKRPVRIRNRMTGEDIVINGNGRITAKRGKGGVRMKTTVSTKKGEGATRRYDCFLESSGFLLLSSYDRVVSQSFFKRITKNHIPHAHWEEYSSVIGLNHLNIRDVFQLIYEMNGKWAITNQSGAKLRLVTDDITATLIRTLLT